MIMNRRRRIAGYHLSDLLCGIRPSDHRGGKHSVHFNTIGQKPLHPCDELRTNLTSMNQKECAFQVCLELMLTQIEVSRSCLDWLRNSLGPCSKLRDRSTSVVSIKNTTKLTSERNTCVTSIDKIKMQLMKADFTLFLVAWATVHQRNSVYISR